MALEETKTPKLNLKKSLISSSVFSGASIAPKVSFGGLAKAIGSQPSFLDTPKLDVPKANPLADIVSQLQVKFESLSSTVRSNVRKITLLKRVLEAEKKPFGGKEDPIEETNRILVEIQNQLALDFASRITEKKEKLDFLRDSILKKKQKEDEEDLEKSKDNKIKGGNKKADKVIKPITNVFDKIIEFLSLMGAAIIAEGGFQWITNPENKEKVTAAFDWLADNWKWVAGGLALTSVIGVVGTLKGVITGIFGAIFGKWGLVAALKFAWPIALPIALGMGAYWGFGALENKIRGGEEFTEARKRNNQTLKGVGPLDTHLNRRTDIQMDGKVLVRKYGPNPYAIPPGSGPDIALSNQYDGSPIYERVDIYSDHPEITPEMVKIYETWKTEKEKLDALKAEMDSALELVVQDIGHGSGPNQIWDWFDRVKNYSDAEKARIQTIKDNYNRRVAEGKYELGGIINGPSHSDGGVHIEAEGGEYIIRKSQVNAFSSKLFDDFNYNGGQLWRSFDNATSIMGSNNLKYTEILDDYSASLFSLKNELDTLSLYQTDNKNLWNSKLSGEMFSQGIDGTLIASSNTAGLLADSNPLSDHYSSLLDDKDLTTFTSGFTSNLDLDTPLYTVDPKLFDLNAYKKPNNGINYFQFDNTDTSLLDGWIPMSKTGGRKTAVLPTEPAGPDAIPIDPIDNTNRWRSEISYNIYGIGLSPSDADSNVMETKS